MNRKHQAGSTGYTQQEIDNMRWRRRSVDKLLDWLGALFAAIMLIGMGVAFGYLLGTSL